MSEVINPNEHTSESLDDVLRRYQGWLTKTAKGMVRFAPMYEWEDVAQEGAMGIVRAYASYDGTHAHTTGFDGWLMFKARCAMLDVFKLRYMKDQRVDVPIRDRSGVDSYYDLWERLTGGETVDFDASMVTREILSAVAELPDDQRKYVIARFYMGLNEREMTQYMGIGRPANKYWHGRYSAKKRLAEKLNHLAI